MEKENQIILYQPNSTVAIEVRVEQESVWLTQKQIADLFGIQRPAITKHLANIYKSGELEESSTCSVLEHKGNEGTQRYTTKYYNLDAILSVGYRVNSHNATLFRQWANKVLKEYILRGYAMSQRFERLEYRVAKTEEKIDFLVRTALPPVEGVFFEGQIFDAYTLVCDLVRSAKKQIVIVDNYADDSVLRQLDKRNEAVSATIFTSASNRTIRQDILRHNAQYNPIALKFYQKAHDRFLIIDNTVYHIGASFKDLGKKLFAFSKMEILTGQELLEKLDNE